MHDLIGCVDGFLPRTARERPVLVLTGCRHAGKTTALEQIERELQAVRLPYSLDDYATLPSKTPRLLVTLMFGLNRSSAYGRLGFPRLLIGLLVLGFDLDQVDPVRARSQLQQKLETYRDAGNLRSSFRDLTGGLLGLAPGMQNPELNGLISQTVDGLLHRGMLGTRVGRRVLLGPGTDWYRHQDRGLRVDEYDALLELNRLAAGAAHGEEPKRVAGLLWGAFLADLEANFAEHERWDRNCAVLVDNADSDAGQTFLDGLNRALAMRREQGRPDPPLTVIAASRETLVGRALPLGGKPVPVRDASLADYQGRLPDDKAVKSGWYVLLLPSLTEIEIRNLVAGQGRITNSLGQANDELLAPVIFQFTGGHPEATRLIVSELTGSPDPSDLSTVLAKRGDGERSGSVEERLFASLTEGLSGDDVDNLRTLAAAWDRADANRLDLEGSGLLAGTRSSRNHLFARDLWGEPAAGDPAGAGTVVMLPVLRRLLLRRLAVRRSDWDQVFGWLKTANDGLQDSQLYYALALGEVELVATGLAEGLSTGMREKDAISWLDRWNAIASAPRSGPSEPRPGSSEGRSEIPGLVRWADPQDQVLAATASLVAARWLLFNSLRSGDWTSLRQEIAASLDAIAPFAGAGRDVFRTQAEMYRRPPEI